MVRYRYLNNRLRKIYIKKKKLRKLFRPLKKKNYLIINNIYNSYIFHKYTKIMMLWGLLKKSKLQQINTLVDLKEQDRVDPTLIFYWYLICSWCFFEPVKIWRGWEFMYPLSQISYNRQFTYSFWLIKVIFKVKKDSKYREHYLQKIFHEFYNTAFTIEDTYSLSWISDIYEEGLEYTPYLRYRWR